MTLPQVLRAVRRILPSHFDCEDIASDLWLAGWIASGQPPVDDVPISQGVLYGRCIDAIRSRVVQEAYEPIQSGPPIDVDGIRTLVSKLVERASLDEVDQQILFQRFYLDKTQVDIARDLCLSERAVSERLYNLLERLKAAARIENVNHSE